MLIASLFESDRVGKEAFDKSAVFENEKVVAAQQNFGMEQHMLTHASDNSDMDASLQEALQEAVEMVRILQAENQTLVQRTANAEKQLRAIHHAERSGVL